MYREAYTFSARNLELLLTESKTVFVNFLVREGYIDKAVAEDLYDNHAIVFRRPGFFRTLRRKFLKKGEEEELVPIVVKQLSLELWEAEEEKKEEEGKDER